MLRAAGEHFGALDDIVVICDNAPCHSRYALFCTEAYIVVRLESVFEEDEFCTSSLLRLSPYSPMLNPIENLWSSMKSHVKTLLRERLAAFMAPSPDGQTRGEFRIAYLEYIAKEVISGLLQTYEI